MTIIRLYIRIFFLILILLALQHFRMYAQKTDLMIPTGHSGTVSAITYSPDGKYIFSSSSSGDGLKIWNAKSGLLIKNTVKTYAKSILNHPTKSQMVVVCRNKIDFYDLNTLSVVRSVNTGDYDTYCGVYGKGNSTLYLAGSKGDYTGLQIIFSLEEDATTYNELFLIQSPYKVSVFRNIAINDDGTELLARDNNETYHISIPTKSLIQTIPYDKGAICFWNKFIVGITNPISSKYNIALINKPNLEKIWTTEIITNTDDHWPYYYKRLEFLNDGNKAIFFTASNFYTINFKTQSVITHTSNAGNNRQTAIGVNHFGENQFVVGSESFLQVAPKLVRRNMLDFKITDTLGMDIFTPWNLDAYHQSNPLLSVSLNGIAKRFAFQTNGIVMQNRPKQDEYGVSNIAISPLDKDITLADGQYSYINYKSNSITDGGITTKLAMHVSDAISYSPDGNLKAIVGTGNVVIVQVSTNKLLWTLQTGSNYQLNTFSKHAAFSKNNKWLVCVAANASGNWDTQLWDMQTGQKKWEIPIGGVEYRFINNDKEIVMISKTDNMSLMTINVMDGTTLKETALQYDMSRTNSVLLDKGLKKVFLAQNTSIHEIELTEGKLIKTYAGHLSAIWDLALMNNEEFLFSASDDNTLRIWDLVLKKEVGKIISFANNKEWALIAPNGRFDASDIAMQKLYFVNGTEVIPLDALYEGFYFPSLMGYILAHKSVPDPNITDIKRRPKAKIFYAESKRNLEVEEGGPVYVNTTGVAEITVSATAPEDKVDEIRLFHNGKAVNLATRGLFVTDNDGSDSKKYTIHLLPGNNSFRAIALNSQRTESEPDEISVRYGKGDVVPTPTPNNNDVANIDLVDKDATLHLIVVGVNAYKGKINPLGYAVPDATAFKEELERDAKSIIAAVKSYFITDAKADRNGIINAFDEIVKGAKPQDVFVFYYAGHGYIHPDKKEFYLVSADVEDGNASLLKNGIPSKELQQYAVNIPAQKQLFILDACQSAGAFEKMLQHDGEQQKALAVVARSTGTHWMAASGSTETAKEFGELGHGVFTYSLLEALKGKAVKNRMITVNGLKDFLQVKVPELIKKYGGDSQYPASYGFGKDFPVELVK